MNILVIVFAVLSIALAASTLKWRANAKLFETCWKESDHKRANLEMRIVDTEKENRRLAAKLADLHVTKRLREIENDQLKWDMGKLTDQNVNLNKELVDMRKFASAPVTVRLQSIIDYGPHYDASTRKEIRGLAEKLMHV